MQGTVGARWVPRIEGVAHASDVVFSMRELRLGDTALLAQATLGNVNWSGPRFTLEQMQTTAELAHYFMEWPADREFGIVAQTTNPVAPVGVVWARVFDADDPGNGFVDDRTPEVSIWVASGHRGNGLGAALMTQILEQARNRGFAAISLSVEDGNPARRLYKRLGFQPAPRSTDPGTLILAL